MLHALLHPPHRGPHLRLHCTALGVADLLSAVNASTPNLSSSSASPVYSHPIDPSRQHATVMRANSKNTAHSPDPGQMQRREVNAWPGYDKTSR